MKKLIENNWYWVTTGDDYWFPAKYSKTASGGWGNDDTWEDFHTNVIDWVKIPIVEECKSQNTSKL